MHNACEELSYKWPLVGFHIIGSTVHHHLIKSIVFGLELCFEFGIMKECVKSIGYRHTLNIPQAGLITTNFHCFVASLLESFD